MPRLLLKFALLLLALAPARAQLDVSLDIQRHMFLRGEALEAKVIIRNLSGHDIVLEDEGGNKWFGFEVLRGVDSPIGAFEPNYQNPPQPIAAGSTVERTVDLLKLFPVNELGNYKVRATIYFPEIKKYMVSKPVSIDISDGKVVFRQTVGVPDGKEGAGQYREVSLITFQKPKGMELYARVEDQATAHVLATYPLGRIISGAHPMSEFANDNTIFVMHMNGPSQYALSKVGINGEWLGQALYLSQTGRATVRKKADGTMVVVGATRMREKAAGGLPLPKLSDRPVPLPTAPAKP